MMFSIVESGQVKPLGIIVASTFCSALFVCRKDLQVHDTY